MGEMFKLPTPHLSFTEFVGPTEVISSKQKKTEINLDINLLSKTNKYKTKQTNQKYQIKVITKLPNSEQSCLI
jgi:hypothetical protein